MCPQREHRRLEFYLFDDLGKFSKTPWRRGWDSNPRKVALHTLSKRADSAALAPLLVVFLHDIARYREIVLARRAPTGEVTVGSCATGARESGQARKGAAFSGIARAPQIAWPSPQPTGPLRVILSSPSKRPQTICWNGSKPTGLKVFEGLL